MKTRFSVLSAALGLFVCFTPACDMASVEPGQDTGTLTGTDTGATSGAESDSDDRTAGDAAAIDATSVAPDGGESDAGTDIGEAADVPGDDAGTPEDAGTADAGVPDGGEPPRNVTCADPPPPGADLPDPLPSYTGGACPDLQPGTNTLPSGGADRQFILVVPSNIDPSEKLPVLFLWHWLGGDPQDFMDKGEIQMAADQQRLIAAVPGSKGDLSIFGFDPQWPYLVIAKDERVEEEAVFFDDMLACIAAKYSINENCVSSAGVSAGALFTDQLAQVRSRRLSSFLSLSGGVGTGGTTYDTRTAVRPWKGADHKLPGLVLWGGPSDWCGVNFATASALLEDNLISSGHFFIECIHNCKHAEPPTEPPPGESRYGGLWRFFLDHPYWLRPGESPYQVTGLPANMPEWCGIGKDSATIRDGGCAGGGIAGQCF